MGGDLGSDEHRTASAPAAGDPPAAWLAFAALVAAFALVRAAGLFGDLWLDEIWSLRLVAPLGSPVEILTVVRHDNNHPLNSLWLYLLQPTSAEWTYRLLAWGTGSAAVALAGLIGRRQLRLLRPDAPAAQVRAAGLLTATAFGGSYLLIHYASEARGYAPAVAFGLLAWLALLQPAQRAARWAPVYWVACGLGLLSHVTVVSVLAAGALWSAIGDRRPDERGRWRRVLWWQLPPWLAFAAYVLGFVRRMEIGGGPEHALLPVLADTAAHALGLPTSIGVAVALPLLVAASAAALVAVWRDGGRALAACYVLAIAVVPPLGIALGHSTLLFPRYFLVPTAFALLLLGHLLAVLWARGGGWRAAVAAATGLFLAANAVPVAKLAAWGRGQYRAALQHVAAASEDRVLVLASDHDFRNRVLVEHYRAVLGRDREVRYVPVGALPAEGADWILVHRLDGEEPPGNLILDPQRRRYVLDAAFPHAALSGWDWFLYRRE